MRALQRNRKKTKLWTIAVVISLSKHKNKKIAHRKIFRINKYKFNNNYLKEIKTILIMEIYIIILIIRIYKVNITHIHLKLINKKL
jgi:hypothetical protein